MFLLLAFFEKKISLFWRFFSFDFCLSHLVCGKSESRKPVYIFFRVFFLVTILCCRLNISSFFILFFSRFLLSTWEYIFFAFFFSPYFTFLCLAIDDVNFDVNPRCCCWRDKQDFFPYFVNYSVNWLMKHMVGKNQYLLLILQPD